MPHSQSILYRSACESAEPACHAGLTTSISISLPCDPWGPAPVSQVAFPLPQFVVLGRQSVGKSRLVESLAGTQFNFVSGTLGLRRPTVRTEKSCS